MFASRTLEDKLAILTGSARYDASCSSSGSRRTNSGGPGNTAPGGICHSWSADGRCVSLLKILLTNHCIYDCAYCVNRRGNAVARTAFTPEEVADLTLGFYRRNAIEGLFLSTGVLRDPGYTMELLIRTARILREKENFGGYLHLKVVPGADPLLVAEAGRYADRLSVNIELPTEESLARIAPDKKREAILSPMRQIHENLVRTREEKKKIRATPAFAPAGQSTQLIVGASPEPDLQILRLAENLYRRMDLRRIYYSAFVPVGSDPRLPALASPPLLREHRLYQADWLLRFYGFRADELLDETRPDFDLHLDPKAAWALGHPEFFPVEANRADYETLLRVPGLGVRSARRIVKARRAGPLSLEDLRSLGVVMKRARHFITASGKYGGVASRGDEIRTRHLRLDLLPRGERQLNLFRDCAPAPADAASGGTLA